MKSPEALPPYCPYSDYQSRVSKSSDTKKRKSLPIIFRPEDGREKYLPWRI